MKQWYELVIYLKYFFSWKFVVNTGISDVNASFEYIGNIMELYRERELCKTYQYRHVFFHVFCFSLTKLVVSVFSVVA